MKILLKHAQSELEARDADRHDIARNVDRTSSIVGLRRVAANPTYVTAHL